ncbi:MAG: HAMP domain-containing histidine kinase [Oscillospiraceae bacterium]|jgi:signal transduction histidine kinase|nr:HAMP domain-containing histidine kinase [Oscillospiraceae bacterium]
MAAEGRRRTGIKARWAINILVPVIIILTFAIFSFTIAMTSYYYSNTQTILEQKAQSTAKFFSNYLSSSSSEYLTSSTRYAEGFEEKNKLELQFLNSAGRITVSSSGLVAGIRPNSPDVTNALELGETYTWTGADPETGEKIMAVSSPMMFGNHQIVGAVRYVTTLRLVDRQVRSMLFIAFIAGAVIIAFVFTSNMFFIRSIVNPIREVNEIAKKIAKGSYGAIIEKSYVDEIGELCDTINNMSVEISNSEKIKNDFIASVSHELRTPLTAISGWGETIMYMEEPEEMRKGVDVMMKEATRLTKLVEQLLEFTMMDSGRLKLHMQRVDVAAEFEEVIFVYMETLKKEGITLKYTSEGELPEITGDAERLKQVFFNIIDNAAKHGGGGGRIDACTRYDGEYVNIMVTDYGGGIPEEDLPYVKQKFYKGATQGRGSGIGLAVSNEIVEMHDGELLIESTVGEGTTVTVRLPRVISG